MKDGIRVLGIDDAAFDLEDDETFLTGVVYRGTEFIEDIRTVSINVDGYDATGKVVELFEKCDNPRQIKAILVDGISFAGFNIVDIQEVHERTGKPVIAVTGNEPDRERFREAMEKSGNPDERFEEIMEPEELELKDGTVYIQRAGISRENAFQAVKNSTIHGLVPEPVRVAHMVGQGFQDR